MVPSAHEWVDDCAHIISQRLAGLALLEIKESGVAVPDEVAGALRRAEFAQTARTLFVVDRWPDSLECLQQLRIPFVVTKGPGIAPYYGASSARPFADIDVLIRPQDFGRAARTFSAHGYVEDDKNHPARRYFDRYCREAINIIGPGGASIDLHHRIPPWYWTTGVTLDLLLEQAESRRYLGGTFMVVSAVHNLLISALHIVSDKSRPGASLLAWRDVLTLCRNVSVPELVVEARRAGIAPWLGWIIGALPEHARPLDLEEALGPSGDAVAGSRRLRYLLPPHFGARSVLGQVLRLPVPNGVLFSAGMLFPSAEFLERKYPAGGGSHVRWWNDSLRSLRGRTRLDTSDETESTSV